MKVTGNTEEAAFTKAKIGKSNYEAKVEFRKEWKSSNQKSSVGRPVTLSLHSTIGSFTNCTIQCVAYEQAHMCCGRNKVDEQSRQRSKINFLSVIHFQKQTVYRLL